MDERNRERLVGELVGLLGRAAVLSSRANLQAYEYDASLERSRPDAIVLPQSTEQVSAVLRLCHREKVPFVARGAGTNLSGGTIPFRGGVIVEMARLNRIVEIDIANQRAVVESGFINLELSAALAPYGYYYAPDPASQKVSTMGGNVGENAGGPHCLKYGVTTNHVLGLEVVLSDGEIVQLGGKALDTPGYDLTGIVVGSEGTLGVVTKITVRIMRLPEAAKTLLAVFESLGDAGSAVSAIIADGIVPAALEMMDRTVIGAVESSLKAGYPLDAEAVLIIELDGLRDGMDRLADRVAEICQQNRVREVKVARTSEERNLLWSGRRGAFGAIARVAPNYLVCDGTVPRTRLPEVLARVVEVGSRYDLQVGNVLHAGDGNLHPLILFDARRQEDVVRVVRAGMEILQICAEVGGTISGEHGIGLEKIEAMSMVCGRDDLEAMQRVKTAFDPDNLCNPGKLFPGAGHSTVGGLG